MPNYRQMQFVGYDSVTSAPTQVIEGNTNSPYRKDAEIRAQAFCSVADWIRQTFDSEIAGPDTLKVLVAPEFYFRFGGPAPTLDALRDSYPNGDTLFINISAEILQPHFAGTEWSDWLIVPGSMFWHRSAADLKQAHAAYFNTVAVFKGGPTSDLTPDELARNAQPCAVPVLSRASFNLKRLMSDVDYAQGPAGVAATQWDAALNPMFAEILDDWEWWRWHAFTVRDVSGPGGRPVVFGLEVCLEHVRVTNTPDGIGVLRTMEQHFPSHCPGPAPEVDVHLVTSCGMTLDAQEGVTARKGGGAAICDGAQPDDAPGYESWPTVECTEIIGVQPNRERRISVTGEPMTLQAVPTNLQVGITGQLHDPLDTVAVSAPMPLPA